MKARISDGVSKVSRAIYNAYLKNIKIEVLLWRKCLTRWQMEKPWQDRSHQGFNHLSSTDSRELNGVPGWIRTNDAGLRRAALYPNLSYRDII